MTIKVYQGIPSTLDMFRELFAEESGTWRTFTSGRARRVFGEKVDEIEALRLSRDIQARILIQKRAGEQRGKELRQLPRTQVGYFGFPLHIGVLGSDTYILSLGIGESESILIPDAELASQVSRIFDKRFNQAKPYT